MVGVRLAFVQAPVLEPVLPSVLTWLSASVFALVAAVEVPRLEAAVVRDLRAMSDVGRGGRRVERGV